MADHVVLPMIGLLLSLIKICQAEQQHPHGWRAPAQHGMVAHVQEPGEPSWFRSGASGIVRLRIAMAKERTSAKITVTRQISS